MNKQVIFHEGGSVTWPRAVKAGDWIFIVSAGIDKQGTVVSPDFEEQLDYAYSEIQKALHDLDASMTNVVEMTIFLTNIDRDLPKVSAIRRNYIADHEVPAVAAIGVSALAPSDPPLLVEIRSTAIV